MVDEDPETTADDANAEQQTNAEELAADTTAEAEGQSDGGQSDDEGIAGAVDEHASSLTGSQGAAATDSPVGDNRGAVSQAEAHLEDTNLEEDRATLKKIQDQM